MSKVRSMVYVLSTSDFEYIKIGSTISPKMRFSNIQTACPFKLHLWIGVKTLRIKEVEAELHSRFAEWRVRGEWFRLPPEQLDSLLLRVNELNRMERGACTISSET